MQNEKKNRKALVVGIVAAVAILAVLLGLLLTQCTGGKPAATTAPTQEEEPVYDLYWNLDREKFMTGSETGMSTRTPEEDGYYHVRFFLDGKEVTVKVADKKLVNIIDFNNLMALEFDEDGIVVGVLAGDNLPVEKPGWEFFVQSVGGKVIKLNSAKTLNGMEVLLTLADDARIYDMSGESGPVGCLAEPVQKDRVYAVVNKDGKVTQLFLYDRSNYMLTHEGECQHCKETVTWYEWKKEDALPTETGHYQLQKDVVVTTQQQIAEDQKVCLDLNGKLVTNDQSKGNIGRIYANFNPGSALALMDTSEEQTGTIKGVGESDQAMCFWVRYGEFHMYGGTLDASQTSSRQTGTAVTVAKDAYAYMHGGKIIGGTARTYMNPTTYKPVELGAGSVCVVGKFVMNGGTIQGGYATAMVKETNADGSPKSYAGGYGGNIFLAGGGVMEMNGGTIKNGKAGTLGGNIYVASNSVLTINAGTISGGQAIGKGMNGGNIYVRPNAVVTINGGSILNGSCYGLGGNVFNNDSVFTINGGVISGGKIIDWTTKQLSDDQSSRNISNVNGTVNMYGGRVAGGVHMLDSSKKDVTLLNLAGSPVIFDEAGGSNLVLVKSGGGDDCVVKVGNLSDRAKIGITTVVNPIFTQPTQEKNADNFVSSYEEAKIQWTEEGLLYGRKMCVCGGMAVGVGDHKCEDTVFAPLVGVTQLPKTGNFFLCEDLSLTTQAYHNQAGALNIDLNGHNIIFDAKKAADRVFHVQTDGTNATTVNLTDTVGGGKVMITGDLVSKQDIGSLAWTYKPNSTFNQYGGILDASNLTTNKVNGAAVYLNAGTYNMYGGEIKGGTVTGNGGGGAVYIKKDATFNMYGGTVSGGTAPNGGNIYSSGTINIQGNATISGGTTTTGNGGNIYVASGAVNMSGGKIVGGHAYNVGGNIIAFGGAKLNISGGQIYGGSVNGSTKNTMYGHNCANVQIYNGTVNMSGGTVSGIFVRASTASLTLSGNAVINTYTDKASGQTSVGLYLGGTPVTIDDSKGAFTGSVAVSTAGYVTNETKETYVDSFTSLVEGMNSSYHDGKVLIGRSMCVCGGKAVGVGDHECEDVLWNPLSDVNQLPKKGNYFLTDDLTLTAQAYHNQAGALNIDLNGHNITFDAKKAADRVFHVQTDGTNATTVSLTDSVGGGKVMITGDMVSNQDIGSLVWTYKPNSSFNQYGGILDASNLTATVGGVAVYLNAGTYNMYGGEIKGGTVTATGGGAVYIKKGATFNMYGGTVSGGQATGGYGGNFRVEGTLNVAGGTITDGYSKNNGGNIYVANDGSNPSKVIVSGGEITNGCSGSVGGNIWAQSSATLEVSGTGKIYGGYLGTKESRDYTHRRANVGVYGAVANLSGGTVSGLDASSGAILTLSGDATVDTYTYTDSETETEQKSSGLYLDKVYATIDDEEVDFTGSIAVSSTGYITNPTEEKYAEYFESTTGLETFYYDKKIYIGDKSPDQLEPEPEPEPEKKCLCGDPTSTNNACADDGHQQIIWTEWNETTFPTATGNYKLTGNLTLAASPNVTGNVNINLNGNTISGQLPVVKDGAVLNLVNHSEGVATISSTVGMKIEAGGSVSLYDGITISGGIGGLAGMIDNYGDMYVYGGSITGFRAVFLRTETSSLYMNNGTLAGTTGNTIYNNGTVVIEGNAVINGGTITSDGSAIYNKKDVTIGGKATVNGGKAVNGGSIYNYGAIEIKDDAVVNGGTATGKGGAIFNQKNVTIGGKAIVNGGNAANGGSIYTDNTLEIKDNATVSGGTATTNGGNIYVEKGTVNVSGGTISGGYAKNVGGNIIVFNGAALNISGDAEIYGGSCEGTPNYSSNCSNVQIYKGIVNMSGGTVSGIFVRDNNCQLNISGNAEINTYTDEESGQTSFGLYLGSGAHATIDDSKGEFTGSIAVSTTGKITNATKEEYVDNFVSKVKGYVPVYKDSCIYLQEGTNMCLCGDPNSTGNACADAGHKQILWTAWNETTFPTETGNYVLQAGLTLTTAPEVTGKVNVNLKGNTISGPLPVVKDGAVLNLVNHSENAVTISGTAGLKIEAGGSASLYDGITISGSVGGAAGMIDNYGDMYVYGGSITGFRAVFLRTETSSLYMNNGTLAGTTGNTIYNNGTVVIEGNAVINGGTITSDGSAIYNKKDVTIGGKATVNGGKAVNGGSIYNYGAIEIKDDAVVNGGTATGKGGAIFNQKNVTIGGKAIVNGGNAANGGSIYTDNTLEIKDNATVSGGTATTNGGNIYVEKGTVNVSGGTISGGYAKNVGGNIIVFNGAALNISGDAEIYGGSCEGTPNYSSNCSNVQIYKGIVNMSGGTVSGIFVRDNNCQLNISGNAEINTYTDEESGQTSFGLYLGSGAYATIDDSKGEFTGSIAVSTAGKITNQTDRKYAANFFCDGSSATADKAVYYNEQDGGIYIGNKKTMCVCGGQAKNVGNHVCGSPVEYTLLSGSTTQLPKTGNYFLGSDLVLTTQSHLNSAGALNIDLNGHVLTFAATAADGRVFKLDGNSNGTVSVNLTDSVGGGKVTVTGDYVSSKTSTGSLVWTYVANTTFNQYGGILDASNLTGNAAGVAVYLSAGTYNMYGGQIKGGTVTATGGGAVYINSGAEFNLYGGTVSGGKTSGTVNGGNFYVNGGTLDVSGGEIVGGYASNVGGNVFVANSGTLKVSGDAKIYGGSCQATPNYSHNCANVQVYKGTVNLSGGTVSGIFVRDSACSLTLSGNAEINTYTHIETDSETGNEVKQNSVGLYLGNTAYATIDDSQGEFTGSIAVSTTGRITSATKAEYLNCFTSLVGKTPTHKTDGIYME